MFDTAYAQNGAGHRRARPDDDAVPVRPDFRHYVFYGDSSSAKEGQRASGDARQTEKERRGDDLGGIYGKVVDLKETVVTLEVAPNVRIRVHRPQITAVLTGEKSATKEGKD